jgi:hypothetical protein
MDVQSQQVFTEAISKMFQMYSHKATRTSDVLEVLFTSKDPLVKITDMNGWTDVKSIKRIENSPGWRSIIAANQHITLTNDTLIPVYEPEAPFKGFHGETKYPFTPKLLYTIEESDIIRIRRGKDKNDEDIEFTNISSAGLLYWSDEFNYGYEVTTRSGFFNADNIHLLGQDNSKK